MLAMKFMSREWTPRNQELYLIVAGIRDKIKQHKLRVKFTWVDRT